MGQAGISVVVEERAVNKIPTFKNGNGERSADNKQVCNAVCSMCIFLWRKTERGVKIGSTGLGCKYCFMEGSGTT